MKLCKKVVAGLILGVAVVGLLAYWKRYEMAAWYMRGNGKLRETVLLQMAEDARPVIEREIKMSLPEKILSRMTGKRAEGERRADALEDVRDFGELSFKNRWLAFRDVHKLDSLGGFKLDGLSFALVWDRREQAEVLAAFIVNVFKRKVARMKTNEACGFFTDLRLYIEKRAREH